MRKELRLSFILFLLVLLVLMISNSACGLKGGQRVSNNTEPLPEIAFRQYPGALVSSPGEGGRKVYFYFEVIRGSGDVELTIEMRAPNEFHDSNTASFYVEEGVYQLMVVIHGITGGASRDDLSRFEAEFALHSPAAVAKTKTTRKHMLSGQLHKDSASLGAMTVEPWDPPSSD